MIPTRLGQRINNSTFVGFLPISNTTIRIVMCTDLVCSKTKYVLAIKSTSIRDGVSASRSVLLFKRDLAELVSRYPKCRLPSYYETVMVIKAMHLPKYIVSVVLPDHLITNTQGCSLLGIDLPMSTIFPSIAFFSASVESNRVKLASITEKQHQQVQGLLSKSWVPIVNSVDITIEELA